MESPSLGQLIAERKYVLKTDSESIEDVIVRIGSPQESSDGREYFCPFEIVGLGTPKIRGAYGVDAMQALQLTLKMVGTDLHYFRQQLGDSLYLHETGDDLGFPEEAWTEGVGWQIVRAFGPVYGMKLSIARSAGSMKNFQFGVITPRGKGAIGQYALHIQCPWRFVRAQCAWRPPSKRPMVAGSGDQPEPENALAEFFTKYDEAIKSCFNVSDQLVVQQVESDDYGSVDIRLSGDCRLQVFPDGSSNEQWRLFQPGTEAPHVVFENGALRQDPSARENS